MSECWSLFHFRPRKRLGFFSKPNSHLLKILGYLHGKQKLQVSRGLWPKQQRVLCLLPGTGQPASMPVFLGQGSFLVVVLNTQQKLTKTSQKLEETTTLRIVHQDEQWEWIISGLSRVFPKKVIRRDVSDFPGGF